MIEGEKLVNPTFVVYSIGYYVLSWVGYYWMSRYNQGLDLQSSKEMFTYCIFESIFQISMALGFFYSWQTYSKIEGEL